MVHGDDFVSAGASADLAWLKKELEKRFEIKTKVVGSGDGEHNVENITIDWRHRSVHAVRNTDRNWWAEAASSIHASIAYASISHATPLRPSVLG